MFSCRFRSSVAITPFIVKSTFIVIISVMLLGLLQSGHQLGQAMLLHSFLMTVLAPVLAFLAFLLMGSVARPRIINVWTTALAQILVFLYWHSPAGMTVGMHSEAGKLFLNASVLVVATIFWWSLLRLEQDHYWQAALVLLITGKVFCLVALLMTFAPRSLYPAMSLEDQQLAGLIMITLCPVCYVAVAVWMFWRWLRDLEQTDVQLGARST